MNEDIAYARNTESGCKWQAPHYAFLPSGPKPCFIFNHYDTNKKFACHYFTCFNAVRPILIMCKWDVNAC